MNILHYSLGLPPFRRGGMTTYCMDLMWEQVCAGNKVSLIWPQGFSEHSEKSRVVREKDYTYGYLGTPSKNDPSRENRSKDGVPMNPEPDESSNNANKDFIDKRRNDKSMRGEVDACCIHCFSIRNAMPVPLIEGIRETELFSKAREISGYRQFFSAHSFDVLHLHTLMGLPREFLSAAKESGIRIVYTVHDYFGLCPKCFFVYFNSLCPDPQGCSCCESCNENAFPVWEMHLLESSLYRRVKETRVIKKLRQRHLQNVSDSYQITSNPEPGRDGDYNEKTESYLALRDYYRSMLDLVNQFHFNSKNNLKTFSSIYDPGKRKRIISITNEKIADHKKIRHVGTGTVRFGYFGSVSPWKGLPEIIRCCDRLARQCEWHSRNSEAAFRLVVYNGYSGRDYVETHMPYQYEDLPGVMDSIDVLVVPGIETFGFTVLEALSYGIPVIVKDTVGAKDLIEDHKNGRIVHTEDELVDALREVLADPSILNRWNEYIVRNVPIKTMQEHAGEMVRLYQA